MCIKLGVDIERYLFHRLFCHKPTSAELGMKKPIYLTEFG